MVALRKESVDRNQWQAVVAAKAIVALRKESVDRNQALVCPGAAGLGRSPQGERG